MVRPRAPADSRVNARPVLLVARIGCNTGWVAGSLPLGSLPFAIDTGVAAADRDVGIVNFVCTGFANGDDDATIVTDVIIPDNASRSFMPATFEDCDVR